MGLVNNLDKQYTDLIDNAYRNYLIEDAKILPNMSKEKMTELGYRLTQEQFTDKIKTDAEFCKMLNVTFEKRELSEEERICILHSKHGNKGYHIEAGFNMLEEFDIPTKLIKITYNGQTRESYE